MQQEDLDQQIAGIAALNEPWRRDLYRYVAQQPDSVSRDQAAEALGIGRALAAFHLDKLVEEGLLDVEFRRLSGRTGPGAGRPSKLYRRSVRQFDVSLPQRSYELVARLFARTLTEEPSTMGRLSDVAYDFGTSLGEQARELAGPDADRERLLDAAEGLMSAYGYEPYREPGGALRMRNCPFHVLSRDYRGLVCGMNLSLMEGVLAGLNAGGIEAVLDPQPGMCCVVFRRQPEDGEGSSG